MPNGNQANQKPQPQPNLAGQFNLEKTTSYQVKDLNGNYLATTYSPEDADVVAECAKGLTDITALKATPEATDEQPKGIYLYVKNEPTVEVYDPRLAECVLRNMAKLIGAK